MNSDDGCETPAGMFEVFATPEEIRLEVEPMPALASGSDLVRLLVRGDSINGKVMFDPDGAEEFADRLITAAAEAAEGDEDPEEAADEL
jgi:hypothetical protein